MNTQELVDITRTFQNRSFQQIRDDVGVGDYLCCMNVMRPIKHEDGTTLVQTEWVFYPVTKKTRTALYTQGYRWERLDYTVLKTKRNHCASCWVNQYRLEEWMENNQFEREDDLVGFLIRQTLRFINPTITVEEQA